MIKSAAFRWTLAWVLFYLTLVVGLPLIAFGRGLLLGGADLWAALGRPRLLSALTVSFSSALIAAGLACALGLMVAWVLERYRFPFKAWMDRCVDLPLALPTAVGGLALAVQFSPNGFLGAALIRLGLPVAFTRLGIVVALLFTALPAVIRSLQPTLRSLDLDVEEAAACLGATPRQRFHLVVLPQLYGVLASAFLLAFARALAEYGSVAFISGNLPLRTETVPVLVLAYVEQGDLHAANALALVHLGLAALLLAGLGRLQDRLARIGAR